MDRTDTTIPGVIIGVIIALALGPLIRRLVNSSTKDITLAPPEGVTHDEWQKVIKMPNESPGKWLGVLERQSPGEWLGVLERLLSLGAFWINAPELVAGWLVLKLGSKWEIWHNIVRIPESLENTSALSYFRARRAWGSWLMMRFLIGTLGNLLAGFLAACIGKYHYDIVRYDFLRYLRRLF